MKKGGFRAYTKELTLDPGGRQELTVALEPLAPAPSAVAAGQPVTEGRARVADVGGGSWVIEGEELLQRAPGADANLRFGSPQWTDYDFSYKVRLVRGTGHASAAFRAREPFGGVYFFHLGLRGIIYGTIIAVVGRCAIWMPWYVMKTLREGRENPVDGIEPPPQ